MTKQNFAGDKKKGLSLFGNLEKKLVDRFVDKIPKGIETYHLTLTTIIWCLGILGFSYLAKTDIKWLWAVSLMILLQYITDLFDGAVGRYRNTGLVKWGFYMDHFLDYIFMSSIVVGYSFIYPEWIQLHFFILIVFGAFMVNSFLSFAATNEFKIEYLGIGPTEIRLVFILTNTAMIMFGTTKMGYFTPYVLGASFLGLIFVVYKTQKYLWKVDMQNNKKR